MNLTQKRYEQAKTLIPGGVQLLSKKPEMYDGAHWPAYHSKAKGCQVWDLEKVMIEACEADFGRLVR